MALKDLTRDEHYAAIEDALTRAGKQLAPPAKIAAAAAEAQVHAALLVEKALRERG